MKDQVDGLRVDGVAASYLNSTLLPHERDEVLASVRDDRCRLLYVSPERIVGEGSQSLRRMLQQCGVSVAHRRGALHQPVGPRFPSRVSSARPPPRRLSRRARMRLPPLRPGVFARHRLRAATAGSAACWSILRSAESVYRVHRRGNLHRQLQTSSAGTTATPASSTARPAGKWKVAEWLQQEGHCALPYHAGLADDVRSRHQEAFLQERVTSSSPPLRSAWGSIART
jgi:ATP-dependent DNA helicase RecQ